MNNASIIALVVIGFAVICAGVLHDRSFKAEKRADQLRLAKDLAVTKARHAAEDQKRQRITDNIKRIGEAKQSELKQMESLAELWKGVVGPEVNAKAAADLKAAQEEAYKASGF